MIELNNKLLNLWLRKLEVPATVILLLYFLSTGFPSPIPKLMNILSYPMIAVLVSLHWKRISWVAIRDLPLLLLIGLAFASALWSADLEMTINGCRGLLRTVLLGAYFSTCYSLKEQMKILTWVFGMAAILTVMSVILIPSYGMAGRIDHPGALQGIFDHKNSLGYAMTLGAVLFLLTAIQERKPNWLAWSGFALTIVLTLLAYSSSALMSLLLLISLIPVYQLIKQHYKLQVVLLSIACILGCAAAIFIFGNSESILVDILGESTTFSGRTPIWDLMIKKTLERPWLGYGINAFWSSDAGVDVILNTWAPNEYAINGQGFNAHSGYLAFLPQLGFLGIFIYAISFITVFVRVFILLLSTKKIEFFWFFQLLTFLAVANFADQMVSILGSTTYTTLYVSISLSTAVEWRRIRVSHKRYARANIGKPNRSYSHESKIL
jgi:exopolysaccharide production protein ExoQ